MDEQTLKKAQTILRQSKMYEFKQIGKKTECKFCAGDECLILRELYCKKEVCHFYENEDSFYV